MRKGKRQQRKKYTKKLKSLPSGERLSGVFTRFLSDEPLEDKSLFLSLSPRCLAEREILSALWSESTLYDRQADTGAGRHCCQKEARTRWDGLELMAGWWQEVCTESHY